MTRVLITGGRKFLNRGIIFNALESLHMHPKLGPIEVLIHGCAAGVDSIAGAWAYARKVRTELYPVTPEEWKTHGKVAGHLRNKRMFDLSTPDYVVAFPGGNGTRHMIGVATAGKTMVIRVGANAGLSVTIPPIGEVHG